jgi:hypothetical protein
MNYLFAYRYDTYQADGFPYEAGYGSVQCSPTVADLNLDGIWEIIFVSENDSLHVVQQDGTSYPGFPIQFTANNITISAPSPAVGDFDQDGELEIVAVRTISSLSAWLHVIDTDVDGGTSGQNLTGWPQPLPGNSESSPVVGDLDGDGLLDILFGIGGANESPNVLYAFQSNGDFVDGFPITLGGPVRPAPVITDLDRDGDVDIVYGGWDLELHVWDMPFVFDELNVPWPTFRGNQRRDGVYRSPEVVAVTQAAVPKQLLLQAPYPNPFNPSTTVRLYLPGPAGRSQPLQVGIYNVQGRQVRLLHDGPVPTGWHTWVWDGRDGAGRGQASGLYFLRARTETETRTVKMSLIK